ncbi:hypothetical protein AMK28_24820 [Streptomyces sp. CB02115]|nr:hypothetical protein AMK28_24820 [Streptomyces sp. CB02115]
MRREGRAAGGEAAVGDDEDDVGAVELAGGAVDPLEVGVPTAEPRSPSLRCFTWMTQARPSGSVARTSAPLSPAPPIWRASVHPSRSMRSRIAYSKSRWCRASSSGSP